MNKDVICYNEKCSDWQTDNICWPYSQPSPYKKGSEKKCPSYIPTQEGFPRIAFKREKKLVERSSLEPDKLFCVCGSEMEVIDVTRLELNFCKHYECPKCKKTAKIKIEANVNDETDDYFTVVYKEFERRVI